MGQFGGSPKTDGEAEKETPTEPDAKVAIGDTTIELVRNAKQMWGTLSNHEYAIGDDGLGAMG